VCSTALALLRTCRRVRDEIRDGLGRKWIHESLFDFHCPEVLLDKSASIPVAIRCEIRRVRIVDSPLFVWKIDAQRDEDKLYYRTAQILKLLPGLKLDSLTVYTMTGLRESYTTLDTLVRYSDGWNELHFLSSATDKPQPPQ
jgi:hypothetical protein